MATMDYEDEYEEVEESEYTEDVYLSFLWNVRNEYKEFGADEEMFIEMNQIMDEILQRWYDDGLQKVYDEFKSGDKYDLIEPLMEKVMSWLKSRV